MRNVIIIGNSGAARECYWLLEQVRQKEGDLVFKGFLSFEGFPADLHEMASMQICSDDEYQPSDDDVFIIGIGHPVLRWKAYTKWKEKNAKFMNLIHPEVHIPESTYIGEANVIAQSSFISCNITIGNANFLNNHVSLGHDSILGDANFIGAFSVFLGRAAITHRNRIGVHTTLMTDVHMGSENATTPGSVVYKGCVDRMLMSGNPAFVVDDNYDIM